MRGLRISLWAAVFAAVILFAFVQPGAAQSENQKKTVLKGPELGSPVTPYRIDIDVSTLPAPRQWQPGDPIKEVPRRSKGDERFSIEPRPVGMDPVAQLEESKPTAIDAFTVPSRNFAGGGFTGVNPPDTNGDVGPNHYIQTINMSGGTQVRIWDKATPTPNQLANFALDSLGSGNCANGLGDPIVLYDRQADRWLLSEFSSSGNNLCVYISQTPNPVSGGWFAYAFTAPQFPDYPKYAVWPTDANGGQGSYIVTSNEDGPVVYALPRGAMLAGGVATSQRFSTIPPLSGFPFEGTLAPADIDGANLPPSTAPAPIIQHRDTEVHGPAGFPTQDFLEVWEFDVDWTTPANTTLTLLVSPGIPIAEIDSDLCGLSAFACFPQPGSGTTLDPLREPVMNRLQYINHLSHQALVGDLVTDVNGADHGGMRWFELRGGPGAWTLFQEGTYSPDIHHRWIGGIAADQGGNIALGYSVSSTTVFPSMRYTGRIIGDPAGTMSQPETTIIAGSASNASNRWGDYANMSLDPSDDCTFWYTNMFNATTTWSTQVASFKFDACGFAGTVSLLANSYSCSSVINITVADANLIGAGTQNVTIWSDSEPSPNPETIVLTETPPSSGVFAGSIPTTVAPPGLNNGLLTVADGDTITVHYVDADDGQGGTNVPREDTALADCTGPVISNVQAINIGATTATLTWDTNENADSFATYDTITPPAAFNASNSSRVTSHVLPLAGLTNCTQYFFFVRSTDEAGNQATNNNGGTFYTFTTQTTSTATYNSTDVPKTIMDLQTVNSVINVPDNKTILDVNLQLNITHTWDGDVDLTLTSPAATTVEISTDNGGSGDNYNNTIFDDEAATSITAGTPPFAGTFRPEGLLSAMDNASALGTWTLHVADDVSSDTGTLNSWSLTLTFVESCGGCPTITLDDVLPDGTLGSPYNGTITASGGASPYTYSVTSGSLPNGLTLNTNGTLTGTPTASGTFNFTVTATDLNNCTGSRSYSISISCPAITLDDVLPDGTVGSPYTGTITASGGASPYTYAVTSGSLPTGLTLNTNGTLTGTPTASGTFNFTVTATDLNNCTGSQSYSISIGTSCPTITLDDILPDGSTGTAYSSSVTASGGTAPYTYNVSSGAVPDGLTLSTAGTLSGTPTADGVFNFSVTATDASSCTGTNSYSITITCGSITLDDILPDGSTGTAYSSSVTASGGTAPYTYSVSSGAVPDGLTLSAAGALSGTPTVDGVFNFNVTATDASGCTGTNSYSVTINCGGITLDDTLADGTVGVAYSGTILATGGTPPFTFAQSGGSLPDGVTLNPDGTLTGTPTAAGTFNFDVTATDSSGCTGTLSYSVTIASNCIFNDDFSNGTVDWLVIKPSVAETGGNLVLTPTTRKAETVATPVFAGCSACSLHTTVQTAGGNGNRVWVLGWYTNKKNTVELLFKEEKNVVILKQRVAGHIVAKQKATVTIDPNTVYDVVMGFNGTQISVSIAGNPVITLNTVGAPNGVPGFRAKNTTGTFDFVCVN